MKTLYFFVSIFFLFLISCNDKNKQHTDNIPEIVKTNNIKNIIQEDCLDLDSQIYLQTTILWKESWKFENPDYKESIPIFHFSKDSLLKLKDGNADGIRMFYILKNKTETVPSIALVNMEDCSEQNNCEGEDCVLIAELSSGSESFISYNEFVSYRDNWIEKADIKEKDYPVYTAVYAYNYSWSKLLETAEEGESGIWVQYGLRTLGPLDSELYIEDREIRETTGNIVYCNIIYQKHPNMSTQKSFDFAKPCPRFCPKFN